MDNPVLLDRVALRRLGIKLSDSSLRRMEAAGRFPKRVRLGEHTVAWLAGEIDAHIDALTDAREARR